MSPRGAPPRRRSSGKTPLKILVLSGPNLDRLGTREPHIYGSTTLPQIHAGLSSAAQGLGASVDCKQSNHEGDLVTWIGAASDEGFAGILINAGAYTHTSVALHDAIKGSGAVVVELHITNVHAREPFRHHSYISPVARGIVVGFGVQGYAIAIGALMRIEGK